MNIHPLLHSAMKNGIISEDNGRIINTFISIEDQPSYINAAKYLNKETLSELVKLPDSSQVRRIISEFNHLLRF